MDPFWIHRALKLVVAQPHANCLFQTYVLFKLKSLFGVSEQAATSALPKLCFRVVLPWILHGMVMASRRPRCVNWEPIFHDAHDDKGN